MSQNPGRPLAIGLILAALAAPAWAVWVSIPLPSLIKDSDLIVVGRLSAVHQVHAPGYLWWQQPKSSHRYEGTILIERTLWPPREALFRVTFEWGDSKFSSESVPYGEWAGRPFLWLLQRRPDGKFGSNYPGRALPMDSPWTIEAFPRQLGDASNDTPAVRSVRQYVASLTSASARSESVTPHAAPTARGNASATGLPRINDYVHVDQLPEAIFKVAPIYPDDAKRSGIEGLVIVKALVGRDGAVKATSVLKSAPELAGAAETSVKRWKFRPARSDGKAVAVWVSVPVRFALH